MSATRERVVDPRTSTRALAHVTCFLFALILWRGLDLIAPVLDCQAINGVYSGSDFARWVAGRHTLLFMASTIVCHAFSELAFSRRSAGSLPDGLRPLWLALPLANVGFWLLALVSCLGGVVISQHGLVGHG